MMDALRRPLPVGLVPVAAAFAMEDLREQYALREIINTIDALPDQLIA